MGHSFAAAACCHKLDNTCEKDWGSLQSQVQEVDQLASGMQTCLFKSLWLMFWQSNETCLKQKTGDVEEVDEHIAVCILKSPIQVGLTLIQVMTELNALWLDCDINHTQKSSEAKVKADMEKQAASELHDASMCGLVCRSVLSDVAVLPGATVHKKQGQRVKKRCSIQLLTICAIFVSHLNRSHKSSSLDTDMENTSDEPACKKHCQGHNAGLQDLVMSQLHADHERLENAHAHEECHHDESQQTQQRIIQGLGNLATSIKQMNNLQQEELHAEREHQLADSERMLDLQRALLKHASED